MLTGMLLEGSCQCGRVRFRVSSRHPVPYQRCYCSICRKAGGGSGYSINLEADATTLVVEGQSHVKVHRAMVERDGKLIESKHQRHFCAECGSHLWAFHPNWPELLHPVAGAIDSELPAPSEHVHMMVGSKASWVAIEGTATDAEFDRYPQQSMADWHDERGLSVD
jgi:hypothetical protein